MSDFTELVKEKGKNGKFIYRHPIGRAIDFNQCNLYQIFCDSLDRFRQLADFSGDDDYSKFGFVFKVVIRDSESQFEEALRMVDDSIGKIEFDIVDHAQWPYRTGMVLGIHSSV